MNLYKALLPLGITGLLVAGCAQIETTEIRAPTLTQQLKPYLTKSPTVVENLVTATTSVKDSAEIVRLPTPTPIIYEVVENDTLTGIALQHSISLEDLIAANPGIDPNLLTIGLTLTIPLEGIVSSTLPTSTPIPLSIQQPVCYRLADDFLQCMTVVENDQDYPVENVMVMITVLAPGNGDSISEAAIPPLNIIPANEKAAVSAIFPFPRGIDYDVEASLLSVIPVSSDDQRYLQTMPGNQEIKLSSDGRQATITGSIEILPEQPEARSFWVSAVAYDVDNKIVGIRKWVANDIVIEENMVEYQLEVYSLGGVIDRVEILSEIRP